jgi:hypothetical protein
MRGSGAFADIIAQRFAREDALDCAAFRVPERSGDQLDLF